MIILDFETNSSNIHDVIEAAAFRVERTPTEYKIVDTFHRYYISEYPVNEHSLEVHKLSPGRILEFREGAQYEEYFKNDKDFIEFCKPSNTLIAHNISFELRHIGDLITFEKHFCTMKENRKEVGALNKKGSLKMPKLIETCNHFNIDFDDDQYHSAIYDITKTLDILNKMLEKHNNKNK